MILFETITAYCVLYFYMMVGGQLYYQENYGKRLDQAKQESQVEVVLVQAYQVEVSTAPR